MAYEVETRKMQMNIEKSIVNAIHYADLFVSKNYLIDLGKSSVKKMEEQDKKFTYTSFVEITKICYDPQENVQDKLKTVYTALFNVQSSALLLIKSSETGVRFFLGIHDEKQPILARGILEKSLKGNFPGIDLSVIYDTEKIMTDSFPTEYDSKSIAAVSIVPGERGSVEGFVQGMEKFIDTMAGEDYTALFIAQPISQEVLEQKKRGYEKLYTSLSVFSNYNLAYGENNSQAVTESLSEGFSDTINEGVSDTVGTNTSNSLTKSRGRSSGHGFGFFGMTTNHGHNSGKARTSSSGKSDSHTDTKGKAHAENQNRTKGTTDTSGSSITMTTTQQNKTILEILKKIDEQLGRIRVSESYGLFDMACYFSSSSKQTTLTAANTFKALVAGEQTSVENSFVNLWDDSRGAWEKSTSRVCDYLRYGKHVEAEYQGILIDKDGEEVLAEQIVTPANMVSGMELPLIMGLPMKSVNGVSVVTSAEFGRNVRYRSKIDEKKMGAMRTAEMGSIYHMGTVWEKNRVKIDIDSLSGHCFITGTTGSGKSNTTYKLLEELIEKGIKFLVVEPAKGEYKTQFGKVPDIHIFTTNDKYFEMLHLNPFEFPEGIHVAEHLQKLVQVFSACWPLYAAMPAILKEAFEKSYRYCGWDLHHSIHFDNGNGIFPTFHTLLKMLPEIINASAYSSESKGDYTGSMVTRVNSLTHGLIGDIFCSGKSIEDKVLFEENTIIDLSRLQSDETVSLIMGVLIMKLNEYRMVQKLGKNSSLRHVTVLEEAHNILKRVSLDQDQESGNVQGASVGMIRKSIAEMRTYGEGFIIIDQSPAEVDVAAIRNTNTKFIMKLSDKDDFETVGRTIGLNDDQILEIGKLQRGVAVTYQTEWEEPVLTMIDPCGNDYEITSLTENDLDAEKELLGRIVSELIDQHEAGSFNMAWVNSILNKEKRVSVMKKQVFQTQLAEFRRDTAKSSGKKIELRYARLMYELIRCEDLFEIFVLDIPKIKKFSEVTPQMKATVEFWAQQFKVSLDRYFKIEEAEKDALLEYLMVHRVMLTNEFAYKIALAILYP